MFESLTRDEAQALRDMLIEGYELSRQICRERARTMRTSDDADLIRAWYKWSWGQAAMRQEITGICSQVRREVLH